MTLRMYLDICKKNLGNDDRRLRRLNYIASLLENVRKPPVIDPLTILAWRKVCAKLSTTSEKLRWPSNDVLRKNMPTVVKNHHYESTIRSFLEQRVKNQKFCRGEETFFSVAEKIKDIRKLQEDERRMKEIGNKKEMEDKKKEENIEKKKKKRENEVRERQRFETKQEYEKEKDFIDRIFKYVNLRHTDTKNVDELENEEKYYFCGYEWSNVIENMRQCLESMTEKKNEYKYKTNVVINWINDHSSSSIEIIQMDENSIKDTRKEANDAWIQSFATIFNRAIEEDKKSVNPGWQIEEYKFLQIFHEVHGFTFYRRYKELKEDERNAPWDYLLSSFQKLKSENLIGDVKKYIIEEEWCMHAKKL